jgi:hypothetical protein
MVTDLGHDLLANVTLHAIAIAGVVEVANPSVRWEHLQRIRESGSCGLLHTGYQAAVQVTIDHEVEVHLTIEEVAIRLGAEAFHPNDAGVESQLGAVRERRLPNGGHWRWRRTLSAIHMTGPLTGPCGTADARVAERVVDHLSTTYESADGRDLTFNVRSLGTNATQQYPG